MIPIIIVVVDDVSFIAAKFFQAIASQVNLEETRSAIQGMADFYRDAIFARYRDQPAMVNVLNAARE